MMNPAYITILQASAADRRDLFLATAQRLGTNERNVEKDFWVCWTLDVLFNGRAAENPRFLFKGGTSLAKAFGLINRFSEDVDVTVFRQDIGESVSVDALEALSGKKRLARLDSIRAACHDYVIGGLFREVTHLLQETLDRAGISRATARVTSDPQDPDGQTLLVWYPSVTEVVGEYVQPAVRIESGAKSALDPHVITTVCPFVANDISGLDLAVSNVTTIDPRRTFWDKVMILHGLRRWFERRGVLRQEGARISRHYYDVHQLMNAAVGGEAVNDITLARDCARHARMFFHRPDLDLATAVPGSFALTPAPGMLDALQRDYASMSGMIFGPVPDFYVVVKSTQMLESLLNDVRER